LRSEGGRGGGRGEEGKGEEKGEEGEEGEEECIPHRVRVREDCNGFDVANSLEPL
jgi:hypothetical protein